MSDWMNDFELAVGAVFDDDASRQVIQDFLRFAGRMDKAAADSYRTQDRAQSEFHKGALKDQRDFGRKFTDAEKQRARALMVVTREFLRERARAERAAADDARREFERQEKNRLVQQRAANQRTQAIIAAGLKDAEARRKSAAKIREQDNASGLRRFENQEKQAARALERIARETAAAQAAARREAGRNLERVAKEQAAAELNARKEVARNLERLAKQQAAEEKAALAARNAAQARADRERLALSTQAAKEEAAVARREGERLAQQQKQQDRLLFNSEQESSARRIARAKAFYSTLSSITRSGSQAALNVVTSFFRRREAAARSTGDRITNIDRSSTTNSTSVIRQQLDAQNRAYTVAAQKRLAIVERSATAETKAITAGAVKREAAISGIEATAATGVIGAATGRSRLSSLAIGGGIGAGVAITAQKIFGPAADYEQTRIAFEGILGSAEKAADFLGRVRVFAAKTPFELPGLLTASKQLLAVGFAAGDVIPTMTTLGNVAATLGVGEAEINGVVRALGQMKGKGKASAEELNQISEQIPGFSAVKAIAEGMGISVAQTFKMMEKGAISGDDGVRLVLAGMEKFPGAAGAMERQSKTLNGAMSTLRDTLSNILIDTMTPLIPLLAKGVAGFSAFIGKLASGSGVYQTIRSGLAGLAAGLLAIIAAKGAVQVISLLNGGLKLLALNPGIAALAALSAGLGIFAQRTDLFSKVGDFFGAVTGGAEEAAVSTEAMTAAMKKAREIAALPNVNRDKLYGTAFAENGRGFDPVDELPEDVGGKRLEIIAASNGRLYKSYEEFKKAQEGYAKAVADGTLATSEFGMVSGDTAVEAKKAATGVRAAGEMVRAFYVGVAQSKRKFIQAEDGSLVPESFYYTGTKRRLYETGQAFSSFFTTLVDGTKNWYLVGYRIAEPIKNLSNMVLLQSSIGAFARTVVDGFGAIGRGVSDLRDGLGTGALEEAMRQTLRGLGDVLTPARDVVADGLRTIFENGRDFLTLRALPILGEARLSIGSFLLPLLGLTGGDGGVVSRFLTTAIAKLFLGSITSFNPALPAAQLGLKGRAIIDGAIEYAQGAAANVQSFFGSLFGGDVDFTSFASKLGGQLNATISGAFGRLKERVGPVTDLLSSIGSAIASGFTSFVLPQLIELPRIVGRAISRTVFSEEFLKAITIGAAAIAGAAVVVAGQFVRGFVEGLIQRRGDIAKTVIDILKFTVDTVLGTGNPFIIFGGLLVAAFAGAKVLGGIGTLRNQFAIAAAGMTGDAQKVQDAIERATAAKGPATTSRVGNASLALSDGYRKAEAVVRRVGKGIEDAGTKTVRLADYIDTVGNRLLKLPLDTTSNAAGRLVSGTTGRFVKDTTDQLNGLQRGAGEFANKYAGLLATPLRRGGEAIQRFPRAVQAGLQRAGGYVTTFATQLNKEVPDGADKAQAAMQIAGGAISGYMTGMAETGEAQAIGLVSSLGNIALAYGTAGPIVGSITAVATAVGYFWGESTRASREAEAQQQKIAADLADNAKRIGDAYSAAFQELGSTGASARGIATLRVIQDQIGQNTAGVEAFTEKFGGSWTEISEAARRGNADLKLYTDGLVNNKIGDIFAGNAGAVRDFSKQVADANEATADLAIRTVFPGFQGTREQAAAVGELNTGLREGAISFNEYRDGLLDAQIPLAEVNVLTTEYARTLREGLGASAGGKVISSLAAEMGKAVREQDLMEAAQQRVNRELSATASVAERFSGAWDRVKEGIDRAVQAYQSWIDATTGRQQTRNESITSILGAARSATGPAAEGVSSLERTAEIENSAIEQARSAGAQLEQIWRDAGGNVETFNANARAYFDELRSAAPTDEARDFISQVQYLASSPQAIDIIVNSTPAVKSLEEIQTKLTDAISLPGGEQYAIDLSTEEGTKRAETLGSKLAELYNTDATVKAYIDSEFPGGFAEAYSQIVADTGFLEQITATAKADLDPSQFTEKKNLITTGLDELERRETTLRVTPKLYDPTGGWTKLFGFLGIDLSFGGSAKSSVGDAPPGFNNAERRWGGIDSFATGGITQAHVQRGQRIKYAEPQTGGEAYVPRRGIKARSEAITHQIASWLGGKFIPSKDLGRGTMAFAAGGIMGRVPEEGRTDTYVRNNWDGSVDVLEERTNKVLEHFSAAVVKLNKIMARVSKSMTMAEARTAVLDATAAQREIGPGALAKWNEALTRFFSGGSARTTIKGTESASGLNKSGARSNVIGGAARFQRGPEEGRTDTHVRTNPDGSVDVLEDGTNKVIRRYSAAAMRGGAGGMTPRRVPEEGRTDTHVRNNWDGSVDVLEDKTNKVVEHFSAAVIRLNKIMASVSKAMSEAEARAAVMAATAAQREIGGGAYARWMEALTRFFSGGTVPSTYKGTETVAGLSKPPRPEMPGQRLPKPTRAPSSNRSDTDFSKPQVVVNRNLTVENKITATAPRATALEVARAARNGDFLAGGPAIEMEFAS